MTWETERTKPGKRLFHVVEMDLDFCAETYGVAPCTAALGAANPHKCFNTRVTCQDPANYNREAKTYRFSDPIEGIPKLFEAFPSLQSVETAPTQIDPGKSMGVRASVSMTFADHRHHDRGIDKYVTERKTGEAAFDGSSYEPYDQGTFFGKLAVRNLYRVGRPLRVLSGYLPWDHNLPAENQRAYTEAEVLANLRTHTYVIDNFEGPDSKGVFKVVAKDILRLASQNKAECPVQTTGRLVTAIDDSEVTLTLTPAGVGDSEYAASGTIRIESELMTYTRSGDVFTVVRETDGSTAATHVIDSGVQECKRFAARVDAVINDLLVNFAGISSSFITLGDWDLESESWLEPKVYSTVIVEPTPVETLVNELCRESLIFIWWDDIDSQIRFRSIRPRTADEKDALTLVTGDNAVIEESYSRRNGEQFSRVVVSLSRPSFVTRLDDQTNFEQTVAAIDSDAESADQYNESKVKRVASRWLSGSQRGAALQLASRTLAIFRDARDRYRFRMAAKDADLWTGDIFKLQHRSLQGFRGEEIVTQMQVLKVQELEDGSFEYEAVADSFVNRYAFIGPDSLGEFSAETASNKARYAWFSNADGKMSDGSDAYRFI